MAADTEVPEQGASTVGVEAKATPTGEAGQGAAPSREELVLALEDARGRADQHWDALLRTRAEMDNLRKRAERDVENAHKYALDRFVAELLPVKDSLEMGLTATSGEAVDPAKLREGLELTLKMLSNVFEKFSVEEVNPAGSRFDPERHQAMSTQADTGAEPGTVVLVVQKGYLLNQRLVRPAMVIVAR